MACSKYQRVNILTVIYSNKMLATLPQPRYDHGIEIFDEKLFVIGGCDGAVTITSVVRYNLAKCECKELPQLPQDARDEQTVYGKTTCFVIGSFDARGRILNEVLLYDVILGRSQTLEGFSLRT